MPRLEVTVSGVEDIELALITLGPKIEKRILTQAFRVAAKVILQQARVNLAAIHTAGKKKTDHTARISRGLKIGVLRRRGKRVRRVGVTLWTPTRDTLGIPASDTWYYPAHIELGTKRTAAQPYLRDAFDANVKEAENRVVEVINQEIQKAVG